ncbi:50S ribosomal protein L9 [candidate division WOR-1 bacterium RIFCSPLOWO2_02_FULL_46_20]|uniref:Large ribosomal subunit protein bL9 n=1 Tax=candidate division WOR-1 bacterium RIFCSPLOWO2_02_FULL_46_20 TaxID=1802567 RepID=A0A1F4RBI9_UNCSA|nr:MAG: 50S ribosomal protein L9 [candidate division WOR-1 bacterium RIFCSPLOWO2_02_FULL_46_20]
MKVILLKEVPSLGEADSLVEVSPGYARNYLLPKKIAGPATRTAVAEMEKRNIEKEKVMAVKRMELEALAKRLSALEISIPVDAGEGGKLFGSVTSQDIAEAVQKAAQIEIDKKKLELAEPIKVIGDHSVVLKLFRNINARLQIKVIAKQA